MQRTHKNLDESPFEKELGITGVWLPELMYKICSRWTKTPKILCFAIIFLVPPIVIFTPFLLNLLEQEYQFTITRLFCLLLAASWSLLGPWFISEHHKQIIFLHKYLREETRIEDNAINLYFLESCKKNKKYITVLTFPWVILVLLVLILFPESMIPYGFSGTFDYNYIMFLLYIIFILHLNVIGISGCVMSIKTVYHFSREQTLIKDILVNDKNGMKKFGDYIFCTSLYFASGLLYVPILIDYMQTNHFGGSLIVLIPITAMVLMLVCTFLLPNLWVKKVAEDEKEKLIEAVRDVYYKKMQNYHSLTLEDHVEMLNLYNYIDFLNCIDTSPSELKKVATILLSGVFPVILYMIDNWDFVQSIFYHV